MDALDFTGLTDDQLLGLIRAALREVSSRDPSLSAAARDAMLDEAERARVATEATDREAAKLRAQERERVAREAAATVRAQHAEQTRQDTAAQAQAAAEAARTAAIRAEEASKSWLTRFAALVGKRPADISLLLINTNYGRRVLVNEGAERYAREHLSDWSVTSGQIKTPRHLVRAKPDLAALSAEFAAKQGNKAIECIGANYDWTGGAA